MGPMPQRVAGVGAKHSPLHPENPSIDLDESENFLGSKIEFRVNFSNCPGSSQKSSRDVEEASGDAMEPLGRFLDGSW